MTIQIVEKETAVPFPTSFTITGEQLCTLGEIGPTELIKGEVVRAMPTGHSHGIIESMIAALIFNYLRTHKIGRVVSGEVGVYTQRNPDTVRAVDVAFISNERYRQVQSGSYLDVAPELVVEIMPPANTRSEVHEKLAEYFAIGVQCVWIVDPQLAQVHVYQSIDNVMRLTRQDTLTGGDILPGFTVTLTDIFAVE